MNSTHAQKTASAFLSVAILAVAVFGAWVSLDAISTSVNANSISAYALVDYSGCGGYYDTCGGYSGDYVGGYTSGYGNNDYIGGYIGSNNNYGYNSGYGYGNNDYVGGYIGGYNNYGYNNYDYNNYGYNGGYNNYDYGYDYDYQYQYQYTYTPYTYTYNNPPPQVYPPTCQLSASPTVLNGSGSTTLRWDSNNATSGSFDNGGGSIQGAAGTVPVTISQTTTFTATFYNSNGQSVNCSATVTVNTPPPTVQTPACSITANPTSIAQGGSSSLSWTTINAASASISNLGSVNTGTGSQSVSPSGTTNYTMTVTSSTGQTANCNTTVTVQPPTQQYPSCTISANPNSITQGNSSSLTWTTSNAVSASINNIGSVSTGSGSQSVSPSGTTNYTMTVTSSTGQTATCNTSIGVLPTYNQQPTCSLYSNGNNYQGGSATLGWSTSNATAFYINQGVGSVSPVYGGSTVVPGGNGITYTGTATGPGGTATCQATVYTQTQQTSYCSIYLSRNSSAPGQPVTVSWTSNNATSGYITPSIGNVPNVYSGSYVVYPQTNTTYVGTFSGPNGTVNCAATLITSLPPPNDQTLSSVFLSQVPYTGFEAGPALTVIFWSAIALFAALVAYFVTGGKGMRFVAGYLTSFAGIPSQRDIEEVTRRQEREVMYGTPYPEVAVKEVEKPAYVASVAAPVALPLELATTVAPDTEVSGIPALTDVIESRAHAAGVLMSPEAVTAAAHLSSERLETLRIFGEILNEAVRSIPREDGWIMLSSDRFSDLASKKGITAAAPKVVSGIRTYAINTARVDEASAEAFVGAVVSGDRTRAFDITGSLEKDGISPTTLMTSAATVLDRLYRVRQGSTDQVTPELIAQTASVSDENIHALVEVFTHSLDTVYANQFTGVKLALAQAFEIVG